MRHRSFNKAWSLRMPFCFVIIGVLLYFFAAGLTHNNALATQEIPIPMKSVESKKSMTSPLAGTWYSGNKSLLKSEIEECLASADSSPLSSVQALIVPHAGYRYSGAVAATAYRKVADRSFKRVIVMGPSHRFALRNAAHVSDLTHVVTPLGEVALDVEACDALRKHPQFQVVPGVDEQEHSVQIQFPLLQEALSDFKVVPVVVGQLDNAAVAAMAKALLEITDDQSLVVVSTDFTHYGANYGYVPFDTDIDSNLEQLDLGAWEKIGDKDGAGFNAYVEKTGATICGRYPILILLSMLPDPAAGHLLEYNTSGRMTQDTSMSVSYLSAAFTGSWNNSKHVAENDKEVERSLSEEDKRVLLRLARKALESFVTTGTMPTVESLGITVTPGMQQQMGAFVTLTINGRLRGCIGEIVPHRPLYEAVLERAIDAGINDHRFPRVSEKDLPLLHYEISALTPPRPVSTYWDIELGKHGMVMRKDGYSAVFLPQVAPEQGWTLEETLTNLSLKAGLRQDAWKEGASWTVFEAIVFEEEH